MTELLDLGLLDELTVSVIPVVLGAGLPFFGRLERQRRLALVECRPFPSGIVLLTYRLPR